MNITRKTKPKSASIRVSPLQSVLAQWRGIDLTAMEEAHALTARGIKTLMPKVLAGLGLDRRCAETEIRTRLLSRRNQPPVSN